jgi:hypothetical protein
MPAETQEAPLPVLEDMPQPPEGSTFSLEKIDKVSIPHPYCITPKHVEWASDHCGGMLTKDAIREAEQKHGAACDICRKSGRGIMSIDEHETQVTLFIRVPQRLRANLKEIPGLHEYLIAHKEAMEAKGIQGFGFPGPGQ